LAALEPCNGEGFSESVCDKRLLYTQWRLRIRTLRGRPSQLRGAPAEKPEKTLSAATTLARVARSAQNEQGAARRSATHAMRQRSRGGPYPVKLLGLLKFAKHFP